MTRVVPHHRPQGRWRVHLCSLLLWDYEQSENFRAHLRALPGLREPEEVRCRHSPKVQLLQRLWLSSCRAFPFPCVLFLLLPLGSAFQRTKTKRMTMGVKAACLPHRQARPQQQRALPQQEERVGL